MDFESDDYIVLSPADRQRYERLFGDCVIEYHKLKMDECIGEGMLLKHTHTRTHTHTLTCTLTHKHTHTHQQKKAHTHIHTHINKHTST